MSGLFRLAIKELPVVVLGSVCLGGAWRMFRNTYGAERICRKQSLYDSLEKPLEPYLQDLVDEVAEHFLEKITPTDFAKIRFYMSKRPDISHMGSTETQPGSYIGIPINFQFKNESEVDLCDIGANLVDKDDLLHSLKESLVLSDNAKKFALAQQINAVNTFYIYFKLDVFFLALLGSQTIYQLRHLIIRMGFVGQVMAIVAVCLLMTVLAIALEKSIESKRIKKADTDAAGLGKEYMDGALEFLEKEILRNKLLRILVPGDKNKYSENGENLTRWLDLPLGMRLENIKQMKEKSLENEQQKSEQSEN